MKKVIVLFAILLKAIASFNQLNASFEKDTMSVERDKSIDQTFHLPVNVIGINSAGGASNVISFAVNPSPATTIATSDFQFNVLRHTVNPGTIKIDCPVTILHGKNAANNVLFISIQLSYNNGVAQSKNIVLKISNKKEEDEKNAKTGRVKDKSNYLKAEIVQYSDILGIKNDLPNGLLQFQGILKIPINSYKHVYKSDKKDTWGIQYFRSVVLDATINRVDKSKEEIDYKYTNYIYQNNTATKASGAWLATTDIWRFSNFQAGIRLVPLAFEKGNFRVQLQGGIRLLKNLPYSQDTIRSGVDSGKVKSDFRSVYSNAKFIELYMKTIDPDQHFDLSLNTGLMWLTLMDSYYQQIEIHQQDPFQRATALSMVNGSRHNRHMWFTTLRVGYLIGEEKIVSTFLRLSYMVQTGNYLNPTSNIIDGRPVTFERKKFYNNFFQIHLGTTIEIAKIFAGNKKNDKKEDGTISNSL